MKMTVNKKAIIAVALGNSIFGFSFLFSKIALDIAVPSVMVAMRFCVAFLVMNIIVIAGTLIKRENGESLIKFSLKGKPLKYVFLLALFQPILYFVGESYGIKLTSSAFSGTIIAVIPIVGVVLDVLLMHTRVSKKQVICAVASVAGVIITTLGAQEMNYSVAGILMLFLAVLAGSLFYVFSKKAAEHYTPLERTYVMFAAASLFFVIFAAVQCAGDYRAMIIPAMTSGAFWIAIVYLAVFSSVIAFMLLNFGNTYVSVSKASIFVNLTTVISIVAGVVILGESFSVQQLIGAVIIIGSVYISSIENSKGGSENADKE